VTDRPLRYHFSGIAGAGMNPLAQLMRARGHIVRGSDRALDQGKHGELADRLRAQGIELTPHAGSAVTSDLDRFVYSTAVEADTPEMQAARALGIEMVSRPILLAEVVAAGAPGVAIAGTSGKSTITGMVSWLLHEAGIPATVLGGAALVGEGSGGCFMAGGESAPVVAEACESDGTLVGYRPGIGLIHNITRDHGEIATLRPQFERFADHCPRLLVNAGCSTAAAIGRPRTAMTYGATPAADAKLEILSAGPDRARGVLHASGGDVMIEVPQPGRHNLENAVAAALIGLELGLDPSRIESALSRFPGVARRFEVVGTTPSGVRVVDDYAHNGEKIRAALTTAQGGADHVVAVFQPHGFGPARFLRSELKSLVPALLRPQDTFCYAEIFYAGGTVAKDVSSRLLADDLAPALRCGYAADHDGVRRWVAGEARAGSTVLLMGARDPDLPRLARSIFDMLAAG
jgi:UDP-N-acetylmuramate--alanine ligase